MSGTAPFTWEEMRARFEPLVAPESCEICKHIPVSSWNNLPDIWSRLESVTLGGEQKGSFERYVCPLCRQLYHWAHEIQWNQYDPYNPDLAGPPITRLERLPTQLLFRELLPYRIADDRFGRALAVIDPQLDVEQRQYIEGAGQVWEHHQALRIACGDHKRWLTLSDDGQVRHLSLEEFARLGALDPPIGLDERPRAHGYARFADMVTAESPFYVVESFNSIRWRKDLTAADRASIEKLRAASRVDAEQFERHADYFVVRRWVVADHKLICRVLTVHANGSLRREDAVIGEAIPTI